MKTKERLERIQKSLTQMGIPTRPADLAKMLHVAPSSLSRWLGGEEAKGKQREKIDLLYRTVLKAADDDKTAKRMIERFSRPVAGVGILATGLIGAVAAAGLDWLLSDKEDEDSGEK